MLINDVFELATMLGRFSSLLDSDLKELFIKSFTLFDSKLTASSLISSLTRISQFLIRSFSCSYLKLRIFLTASVFA
jgi:hypothetical protein